MSKRSLKGSKKQVIPSYIETEDEFEDLYEENEEVEEEREDEFSQSIEPIKDYEIAKWKRDENNIRYPVYKVQKWTRIDGVRVPSYKKSKN
jgi:hypothetical protein